MYLRRLTCLVALFATACTFGANENTVQGDFHPPIVYPAWTMQQYTLASINSKVCAISSGANGITVNLVKRSWGIDEAVQSNRDMHPGTEFTISVNGHNFVTSDSIFHVNQSKELIDNMTKTDKAYLEWSELSGPSAAERIRVQNIIKLGDLNPKLAECRKALTS